MAEAFYEDEDNLKKLCDFLRGKEGPAVREAIEMDKRVYYLKGESSESVGRSGNAGSASVGMHSFLCLHVVGPTFYYAVHISHH